MVAVEDPYPDPHTGRKIRLVAAVNRRTDILEDERSRGRISHEAHQMGRKAQSIFEAASRATGGGQWMQGGRVDVDHAKELAIHRSLEAARKIQAFMRYLRSTLTASQAISIVRVLRDGMSFRELAAAHGKFSKRGTAQKAAEFRNALEVLAKESGA